MTPRTLLLDGDWVAHAIACVQADPCNGVIRYVQRLKRDLHGDRLIVCLSDDSRHYFRHDLWPAFKADRPEPPASLADVRETLRLNFQTKALPMLEADDVIGILATGPWVTGERVIVGVDRDLHTIPGLHINPSKPGTVVLSDVDAARNHMTQTLVGKDFPGCPGVGPKSVGRILWGDCGQWWAQVVCAFKGKGRSEADALLQARLARVLRACDYDVAARRVIPWTPDRLLTPQEVTA